VSGCLIFFNLVRRLAEAKGFLKYEVDGVLHPTNGMSDSDRQRTLKTPTRTTIVFNSEAGPLMERDVWVRTQTCQTRRLPKLDSIGSAGKVAYAGISQM